MTNPVRHYEFVLWCPEDADPGYWATCIRKRLEEYLPTICKEYAFQLERGSESDRLHMQGYIQLTEKKRLKTLAAKVHAIEEFKTMHFSAVSDKDGIKKYVQKIDTRVDGPWIWPAPKAKLPDEEDVEFDEKEMYGEMVANFRPFQKSLNEICDPKRLERRKIIWVGDRIGNCGKSLWASWRRDMCGSKYLTYGKANDVACLISKLSKSRTYIFDLPRSGTKDAPLREIINVMEQLKNGYILSMKYEPVEVRLRPPHVVVLANYWPTSHEAYSLCSMDRWEFYYIDKRDYSLKKQPLLATEQEYDQQHGERVE